MTLRTWLDQFRSASDHRRGMAFGAGIAMIAACLLLWRQQAVWHAAGMMRTVIVAAQDIPARTLVTPSMLTTREMPQQYVPAHAAVATADVVGRITLQSLSASDVVRTSRIERPERAGQLAPVIPEGMRAVAVPLDPQRGVGGWLQPGDRVDLFANFEFGAQESVQGTTVLLLQNVPILSVGKLLDTPETSATAQQSRGQSAIMTVAVKPADAQRILFALDNGSVQCALRPLQPDDALIQLSPATAAQVTGMTSLVKRREYHGR